MVNIIRSPQTFYRRTASKNLVQWTIWLEEDKGVYTIKTSHGQKGGTITEDAGVVITAGKSSRTPEEQALLEYDSKVNTKRDQGYTFNTDGISTTLRPVPMLAQPYDKHGHKIVFPALAQPKLDGVRCIAITESDGSITLLTRKGKEFQLLDQIRNAISAQNLPTNVIIDGELFSDELDFQRVVGLVRKKTYKNQADIDDMGKVKLNIFDIIDTSRSDLSFLARWKTAQNIVAKDQTGALSLVPIYKVNNEQDIEALLAKFLAAGDEGVMIRNATSPYEVGKRSYHLQKFKKFLDDEYTIIGAEEGKGNDIGTVVWVCETPQGLPFKVRPKGTRSERQDWYRNRDQYIGKGLTVKYQELTNDGIPRFPVGIAIRDYE
jgi:DNA ligase-1